GILRPPCRDRARQHGVVGRLRGSGRAVLRPRAPPGTRSRPRPSRRSRRRGIAGPRPGPASSVRCGEVLAGGFGTLTTASSVPRVPPFHVARPRLLDMLDAGAEAPLTAVVAPPGAGKSVVLASWVRERCPDATWVACEPRHR